MINQDTIKLLRECDAGTKMGISSIDDVLDNVCNPTFKQKLENSKKEHEQIEKDIQNLLMKYHDEGKEPNAFAKGMSWMETNMKIMMNDSDKTIADIMTDERGYRSELEGEFHRTIKKVTEDIEGLKMNTAIAALMSLLNSLQGSGKITKDEFKTFIILLNPFAPHITEELWCEAGFEGMLNETEWPKYDEAKCVEATVEIVVQVNGKIKARVNIPADISADDAIAMAKADEAVAKEIAGKNIIKELYVPKRLVNIVVK